jgi:hypothetical protein
LNFGGALRKARLEAGISRRQLILRILRAFDSAPKLSAIRDLENGKTNFPQERNLMKFKKALPSLEKYLEGVPRGTLA